MAGGLLLLAGGAAAALAADYAPAAPAAAWARYCGLSVSVAALKDSLAREEFPGVPYWETNAAYFDDPAWVDTFAAANIDGYVLESGDLESRVELLEKTGLDQVAATLIMGLLEAAADGQEGAWD